VESVATVTVQSSMQASRLRSLQALGVLCGFGAGAWLGGAEAPIKIVNAGVSPIAVSLIMVAHHSVQLNTRSRPMRCFTLQMSALRLQ
jgi:hypothetical protein